MEERGEEEMLKEKREKGGRESLKRVGEAGGENDERKC